MRRAGFEVAIACAPGSDLDYVAQREEVEVFAVRMQREIAPWSDLRSLLELYRVMKRWRPDVVNSGTPKAGLLGGLAACLSRVPARIYVLRGLRLETVAGLQRLILLATERTAAACAHEVIAVSSGLAERFVELDLAPAEKVRVLGAGSSNGVPVDRFASPDPGEIEALRERLGLEEGCPVVGFVGRFTRDKGIVKLIGAYRRLHSRLPDARLLLVGDFEKGDPVPQETRRLIESDLAIHRTGFLADVAPAYALMDVLAFPSYREGFPNAPLEAAAAGIPVVGYRATGTVDAVLDGETGILVGAGDVGGLTEALLLYLRDPARRARDGLAGRQRAQEEFAPEMIWKALLREYDRLLATSAPRARADI